MKFKNEKTKTLHKYVCIVCVNGKHSIYKPDLKKIILNADKFLN